MKGIVLAPRKSWGGIWKWRGKLGSWVSIIAQSPKCWGSLRPGHKDPTLSNKVSKSGKLDVQQ